MFERFLTIINTSSLIAHADKVLVAVSGGLDSMVLLHLLRQSEFHFGICHINYGLRNKDSESDEALVAKVAEEIGCSFHLKKVKSSEWKKNQSIQMMAREIRYDFFGEISHQYGYNKIATAHHANDSLETALLHFVKGTGISGLTGIPVQRDYVIRPLLSFTKEELKEFAVQNHVTWREDQSNATNKYQRNIIRNEVIPLLRGINPQIEHTFLNTSKYLRGAEMALKTISQKIKSEHFLEKKDSQELSLDWFDNNELNEAVLFEILKYAQINATQLSDLVVVIIKNESGKQVETSSHHILLDRNRLFIQKRSLHHEPSAYLVSSPPQSISLTNARIKTTLVKRPIDLVKRKEFAFLNLEKIKFPMKIRAWQQGDWFVPFGMKGRKLLSDFMIDLKIPVTLKKDIQVLMNEDDIVWVIGYRTDDRYKIDSQTTEALMLEHEIL
ncbi:MAG: tRNA lysidine(34) synthetase TilS [Cyclobacteriaceae bacterium]